MTIFTWSPLLPGVTDPNSTLVDGVGISTSDIPSIQTPLKPGILTVTLHQGIGFSIPDEYKQLLESRRVYALLDYDKSQAVAGSILGTTENPFWLTRKIRSSHKFDVTRIAELTIYIYVKTTSLSDEEVLLGVTRITPLVNGEHNGAEWLDIHEGTGKIFVGIEYGESGILDVGEDIELTHNVYFDCFGDLDAIGKGSYGNVMQHIKKNTQRLYACKAIQKGKLSTTKLSRALRSQINTPLISTIKFAFQRAGYWNIFQPFISGGHVFYYLQREQCFDVARSTYYLAELLCAFECLHNHGFGYVDLKPRNILLDYWGHIVICDFGLCGLDMKVTDQTIAGTLEFPAPEMILRQSNTKAVDWWTLGIFLFEMVTGLPPFYDEDLDERYRQILSEPLQLPGSLTLPSKDILSKLLHRSPEQRLGAQGVYEIKEHPFFVSLDWQKVLQRKYEPPFKPGNLAMEFREEKVDLVARMQQWITGWSRTPSTENTESKPEIATGRTPISTEEGSEHNLAEIIASVDETKPLHSSIDGDSNRSSAGPGDVIAEVVDEIKPSLPLKSPQGVKSSLPIEISQGARVNEVQPSTELDCVKVAEIPTKILGADTSLPSSLPQKYLQEDDAWELVWDDASQTLHFYNRFADIKKLIAPRFPDPLTRDVKIPFVSLQATRPIDVDHHGPLFNQDYALKHPPSQNQLEDALEVALNSGYRKAIPKLLEYEMDLNTRKYYPKHGTPLQWAIDLEDLQLVELFLRKGANANGSWVLGGRVIMNAVAKRNLQLLEILLQYSDRVGSTGALSLAVKLQDSTMVKLLLENGVCCDFKESDRFHPADSEPQDYLPPLVRAINAGNMHLARLLLANGADANAGYHDLSTDDQTIGWPPPAHASMECGRVIQLAMELKMKGMVDLLLASGADISLAQHVRSFHTCPQVPRKEHLRIMAGLRAAAANKLRIV